MAIKKYISSKFVGLSSDEKPTVPDGAVFYETDTRSQYLRVDGAWVGIGGGSFGFIMPDAHTGVTQGTWARSGDGIWGQYANISSAANNDQIDFDNVAWIEAGTYTFHVMGYRNPNRGILDFLVDGESVGTVDQYGATDTNFNFRATGCVIATSGLKNISIKVSGKNGASTGYDVSFSYISFWKTA